MGLSLGHRSQTNFWEDKWIDGFILKRDFPRIYTLTINKEGNIDEFGDWIDKEWRWKIKLCKNIFGWEQDQWANFNFLINDQAISRDFQDKLVCKYNLIGNYSFGSFCRLVLLSTSNLFDH